MSATAMLTGAAGLLLNYVIKYLVLGMGNILGDGTASTIGLGQVIDEMWRVVRDVCNLAFIFGLIFIGFQTILNVETLNTKKTLVAVIVGALLINFSLFFTQVIIDVSNVLATELHKILSIEEGTLPGDGSSFVETSTSLSSPDKLNFGVAGIFLHHMGLIKFWGTGNNITKFDVDDSGEFAFFFMGTIFLLVAAFVFAAGAVLLIVRFVVLTLLMIFSPILFAGMVFPQSQGFAKGLWKKLLQNAFLAPVYLLMLVLTAKFLAGTSALFKGDFSDAFRATNSGGEVAVGAFAIVLNFVLAAVLLIAALVIAKQMSSSGANAATKIAGRFAFGAASFAGRNTIGRAGQWFTEWDRIKRAASRPDKVKDAKGNVISTLGLRGKALRWAARRGIEGGRYTAKSNFDVRTVAAKTGLDKATGLELGKPQKGGFEQRQKDIAKKEIEFAKALGEDKKAIEGLQASIDSLTAEIDSNETMRMTELRPLERRRADAGRRLENARTEEAKQVERDLISAIDSQIEDVNAQYAQELRPLTAEKKRLEQAKKDKKVERQMNYADSIANKWSIGTFGYRSKNENSRAAEAIKKEFSKSDSDKTRDAITDAIKKGDADSVPKDV